MSEAHKPTKRQSERAIPSDASAERAGDMAGTTAAAQRLSRSASSPQSHPYPRMGSPIRVLEIVSAQIRKALQEDNTELAMAYLPVIDWAVEELGREDEDA